MTEKISDKYPNLFKACRQYPEITLEIQRNSKKCKERNIAIQLLEAIEDIEKEIEDEIRDCQISLNYDAWWRGRKNGLIDALAIIDKHIAESEG